MAWGAEREAGDDEDDRDRSQQGVVVEPSGEVGAEEARGPRRRPGAEQVPVDPASQVADQATESDQAPVAALVPTAALGSLRQPPDRPRQPQGAEDEPDQATETPTAKAIAEAVRRHERGAPIGAKRGRGSAQTAP